MPIPPERSAPGHPLRRRDSAARATDHYMAAGFFGIHLVVTLLAVRMAFFLAVPQWHDRWWAVALFVAGLLPLYAAIGIYRHARYDYQRLRQARYAEQQRRDARSTPGSTA